MRCALHGADPTGAACWRAPAAAASRSTPSASPSGSAGPARRRRRRGAGRAREARAALSGREVEIRIDLGGRRRARRAVRLLALARIRGVQRGVHDVTASSWSSWAATPRSRPVPRSRHGARCARLRRARRRPADQRAGARARHRAALRGRPARDGRADARVRARGARAVSDELCAALEAAGLPPLAFAGGAVDARRVPELGLVGEPVAARARRDRRMRSARGLVPVVGPLGDATTAGRCST